MGPMLEVLIGVFFVFAVASLTCSAAAELLEGLLKNRAKDLEKGLISLVGSRQLGRKVLDHPLIRSLANKGQAPTHLPSRTFAIALLDLVARGITKDQVNDPAGDRGPHVFKRLWDWIGDYAGDFWAFFAGAPAPEAIEGQSTDKSSAVIDALAGPVDNLLKDIPDSALKQSLTGVLAIAKGMAQAEAAALLQGTGSGAALAPGAPGAIMVPGAQAAPQAAAGVNVVAGGAPEVVVPTQAATNVVAALARESGLTVTVAQSLGSIEKWFDDGMDQVTAWYKRRSQFIIFVLGCALAVGMNLDAIALTKDLASDSALRTALVAEAEAASKADPSQQKDAAARFKDARTQLEGLGFPIGWSSKRPWPSDGTDQVMKIIGLLLTALATSLGAPFWFDLLKKVMMVRAGVNPAEDSRQSKQKTAA
ncbi:MAG TPA: hypothetical protein VIG99_04705 [Myxococcaceae bacterium]